MQYAKVYVLTKTNQLDGFYYYKIPAKLLPYIKKYSLVMVAFANFKKKALVAEIVKNVPSEIKENLKSIVKIIYNFGILDDRHLYICKQLSLYYLNNFGQLLELIIPEISKKTKNIIYKTDYKIVKRSYNKYLILDKLSNRQNNYLKIIKKTFDNNKSAMLILPDLDASKAFIQKCNKIFKNVAVFDKRQSIETKTTNWQKTFGKKILIIGTRNAIFRVPNDLGTIIIHQANHIGHKQQNNVYFHTLDVADIISQITGANIFIGQNIEYPNDFGQYKLIKNNFSYFKNTKFVLLNKHYEHISPRIKSIIKTNINKKQKLLIIAHQTGESAGLICSDCKNILYCERCESIEKKISDTKKQCPKCKIISNIPLACPVCKSTNISKFGETAKNIYDKLSSYYKDKVQFLINTNDKLEGNVIVATKYLISYNTAEFDNTVIVDWDSFNNGSSLDQSFHALDDLFFIASFTKNYIYIQTKNTEDEKLFLLSGKKIKQYYKNELMLRKNYNLPPYKKIIKIHTKDKDRDIASKKITKLRNDIANIISIKYLSILEGQKIRNKFHFSLIIKTDHDKYVIFHKKLKDNYKKLKLSLYQIDINPLSLV